MSSDRLETLQARVEALEVKASYSEDLLETLNLTIYRQQQSIDALLQELRQLRQQLPEAGQQGPRNLRDELPPHY
ncbi:MAG: SlyX family protein [Comamonas sp.]|nr:SlyX family protein [Comamonas sp.]